MQEGGAEEEQANQDGGEGGDENCSGANIFADLGERIFIWAGEVYDGFDGGVEEFGSEDQRGSQDNDSPVTRGDMQPQANDKNCCGNGAVDPCVTLGS